MPDNGGGIGSAERSARRASLYITNWSLNEPLCQSQSVAYLEGLAGSGYPSCLITFERPPYRLADAEQERTRNRLAERGICWHPLTYHRRSNLALAAFDVLRGLGTATSAIVRHGARIVHTRSSMPSAFGLVAAKMLRRRFLYDADSELAEEYVGCGYWTRTGLPYRGLSTAEQLCRRHADAIVVLTERLRAEFTRQNLRAPVTVIPCCVDTLRFRFDDRVRRDRRLEVGASDDEKLLVYVGKAGVRYMVGESLSFLKAVRRRVGAARLLVLSHDDPARFRSIATEHQLEDALILRRAEPEEIPGWLSAADAGLSLVLPTPSARGTSPIKTTEYLAAGLPVVTTDGIGDLSAAVETASLGVVVDKAETSFDDAAEKLQDLWRDPESLRIRCMLWARAALDLHRVALPRYSGIYQDLLNGRARLGA